jgi:hypothetical protein
MDSRLLDILTTEQEAGFPGLAGSTLRATIRIREALLNTGLARLLPVDGALRSLTIHPQPANRIGVRLVLAKPSFLPPMSATLAVERQPQLPADPVLILLLTGGAAVLRLAAPAITNLQLLPPGVHMEGGRFLVDIRMLLKQHGYANLLDHAEDIQVTTEEGSVVVAVSARIRP